MPCACKKPVEEYPENITWGPLVWRILHGLAEHSGKQTLDHLQNDERRLWISLLKGMEQMLPCDLCRTHYGFWIRANPFASIANMPYASLGLWIKTWLFNLHNDVNTRTQKEIFLFENLRDTYSRTPITASWKQLEPIMNVAINLNGISLMPWRKWLGFIRLLQGLYGV